MAQKDIVILEIAVDRQNEKGVFVASQILLALHAVVDNTAPWYKKPKVPYFRFEVAHIHGRIRFFLVTEREYQNLLEGQLYAHYPNIEIRETDDFISSDFQATVSQVSLASYSLESIKLYANLKDKTEKESVDPLSAITSALSKTPKNETAFFHVDFSPLPDHAWRTPEKIRILQSGLPDFFKRFLLQFGGILASVFLPIKWVYLFFRFLFFRNQETAVDKEEKISAHSHEKKEMQYGYRVRILLAKESQDETRDRIFLRELSSAMNIFSEPNGNRFVVASPKKWSYEGFRTKNPRHTDILNIIELAGLVHFPTMYVRTPGVNWVMTRKFEPPHNLPFPDKPNTPLGISNFRGSNE